MQSRKPSTTTSGWRHSQASRVEVLAGEVFGLDVQAYPKYGSEKKGLPTTYYLTISKDHVRTHCELKSIELVVLNDMNAIVSGNPLNGLAEGGSIFMQSPHADPERVWAGFPEYAKVMIREKKAKIFYLDMVQAAREVCTSPDLLMRMQGVVLVGAFMKITPYQAQLKMNDEQIFKGIETVVRKYWGKRGETVVIENMSAIKRGFQELLEIPQSVITAELVPEAAAGGD